MFKNEKLGGMISSKLERLKEINIINVTYRLSPRYNVLSINITYICIIIYIFKYLLFCVCWVVDIMTKRSGRRLAWYSYNIDYSITFTVFCVYCFVLYYNALLPVNQTYNVIYLVNKLYFNTSVFVDLVLWKILRLHCLFISFYLV